MSKNESTAIVKNRTDQLAVTAEYLNQRQGVIRGLFAKGSQLDAGRMIRLVLGMTQRTPKLLECSPQSLTLAIMDSAHFDLEPNPLMGHAFIVPYFNKKKGVLEAQFQLGYRGMILLAHRTGLILDIDASVVNANDRFKICKHKKPPFVHEPVVGEEDPGEATGAYATADLKSGVQKFLYLTRAEIEKYRARGANGDAWRTDWGAMSKKTCIRRLSSLLPLDANHHLGQAIAAERESELAGYAVYANPRAGEIEGESITQLPTPKPRGEELAARLKEKTGKPVAERVQQEAQPQVAKQEEREDPEPNVHGDDNVGF